MVSETRIAGIIIQDNKILMLKGKGYKELWTPGGHLEEEETEEDCLRRELKEEIGVELLTSEFFGRYPSKSFYHPEQTYNQHVYVAEIKGDIIPDAEIESYLWLSKEEFLSKKYSLITNDEENVFPDLIDKKIW